jgi:hypothetical protein
MRKRAETNYDALLNWSPSLRALFELPSKHQSETEAVDLSLPLRHANCVEKVLGV